MSEDRPAYGSVEGVNLSCLIEHELEISYLLYRSVGGNSDFVLDGRIERETHFLDEVKGNFAPLFLIRVDIALDWRMLQELDGQKPNCLLGGNGLVIKEEEDPSLVVKLHEFLGFLGKFQIIQLLKLASMYNLC